MSNYLKKTAITKENPDLQDYSLSNNNIDDEYAEILKGMSIDEITRLINKYPDYKYTELTQAIKNEFKINNIVFGSGSEDLIIRINFILKNRGTIGVFLPNFYRIMEAAGDYKKIYVSYDINSQFADLNKVFIDNKVKSVWISNPNPIIGKAYKRGQLMKLIKKYNKILFIIDESTIDFIKNSKDYSLIDFSQKAGNLIVIRSFSKLYGTAGLRVGFATGKAKILKEIERLGPTFPVNGVAEYFIRMILKKKTIVNNIRNRVQGHKSLLENLLLQNKNIILNKSLTNCIFFKHKKINIFKQLLKLNILALSLDNQDGMKKKGFVRLTVHSSEILFNNLYNCLFKLLNKI